MSAPFQPAVSYWPRPGRPIGALPVEELIRVLGRHDSVVLLLHGFNNDVKDATAAYRRFMEFQARLGEVRANVVGVFWPGDNWEGPLFYMKAVGKAQQVAPFLAGDLHVAAGSRGRYRIDIVAHSLGNRLALETVRELLQRLSTIPLPGLTLGKIVFMAGAVPTHYLELPPGHPRSLVGAVSALEGALNLYSEADRVLHFAFPPGQSLAGEGFFPTALGRRAWGGGALLSPPIVQQQNTGADHSDYWGGSSKKLAQIEQAAKAVRRFIDLGVAPPRSLPTRSLPGRDAPDARAMAPAREPARRGT